MIIRLFMYTVKMKPGGSGVEIVCAIFQKFFPGVGILLENLAFWCKKNSPAELFRSSCGAVCWNEFG